MTEKIEKLFAMTEAQRDKVLAKIVHNSSGIEVADFLQSLPELTGEPCGWIIASPANTYNEVEWHNEEMPEAGTKLYTHGQPLQQITEPKGLFIDLMKEHFPNGIEAEQPLQETSTDRNDALCDAAYVAGCSAGFNAAESDDPEALNKLIASRAGYVKVLRESRENTQPPQPITVDMVTGAMVHESCFVNVFNAKHQIATIFNLVIKHKGQTK